MSAIYVNSTWESGEKVTIDGVEYTVGVNAFASFVEAMEAAVKAGSSEIKILSNVSEVLPTDQEFVVNNDIVISADNAVTIALSNNGTSYDLILNSNNNNKITFAKNVTLTLDDRVIWAGYYGNNVDVIIEGTVSANQWWNGADTTVQNGGKLIASGEAMVLRRGATLTVKGDSSAETVELDANYFSMLSGNLVAENATIDSGAIWTDNTGGYAGEGGVLIDIDNTIWTSSGNLKLIGENVIFNIKNGSNVAVTDFDGYGASIVSEKSQLNISNSTFTAKTINNSGTITVAGESTLDIKDLKGNALTFDNATLVDSNINYTGSNSFGLNGVTFKGVNVINSAAFSTNGAKFTVAEDGSFKAVGGRFAFGGNAEWNINGSIKDVKALSDDEKAKLTASLDVSGVSMSTGGGEAVMNVKNAYFTFGSGHITTKNTNATGGKIVMNFENSYVASAYKYAVNPTKADYDAANAPEVELNVKDSVFEINNYFTNNHAKGTVNIDNSNFKATAFGNVGTFSVKNNSVVNFALVNNALGDWAGKGSLNAGTMTIDNSDLTIVNKTVSLEFYNVGTISLTNGAVFTLDRFDNAQANNLTGGGNINTTFADKTGSITIDAASKLVINDYFNNDGTIIIDTADDWKDVAVVIDAKNGTDAETFGTVVVNENDIANGVKYKIDETNGDLIVYNVDTTTVYVDSAWNTGYSWGQEVGGENSGKFYGINAFGSLDSALKTAITYGGAAIEMLDETVATENLQKVVTKLHGASGMDFSITGNSAGNEFIAIEMRDDDAINPSEDYTELATLTIKDANLNSYKIAAYQNSKIYIENSVIDFHGDQNGPIYTKGNGEIYVKDSSIKNTVQLSAMGTVMEFDNSTLEGGSAAQISGAMVLKNNSTYTLSSAKIYGNTGSLTIEDSTMVRKAARTDKDKANSVVYFINGAANIPTAMAQYSYCVFVGGSQYSTTAHTGTGTMSVINSVFDFTKEYADTNYSDIAGYENSEGLVGVGIGSTLNITNSTFKTDLLMNEGTVNVSGDAVLVVNELVGVMNVADAAIADGSYIGGKSGSVDISGKEVNFNGEVTIEAALNANKSSDATVININENAVVTIAGKEYDQYNGGTNLGSTDTLNVNGTLNISGDNLYLKAAANVAEGAVFNVNDAGFQNTYGKLTVNGEMNITDTYDDGAYQNIKLAGNDNSTTTGSLDVDGGTLTINAPSFAFGGGFKSNGWVDVTKADVTVQNGGKITTNAIIFRNGVNSTMNLDNGTFEFTEAGDFGNVHVTLGTQIDNYGVINAAKGSTLDFSDRTMFNYGEINISDSSFTGVITNSGIVELNGDVTLDADAISGTAAVDTDDDAALNVVNYTFVEGAELINANIASSQVLSVNGNAVDMVGDKYVFTLNDAAYTLTESDGKVIVNEWTVADITVTLDVAQTENEYEFVFTATAEGATSYTFVINGQEFVSDTNTFTWTNDAYASELPADFTYYVVAAGKDELDNDTYGKSAEADFAITDYTNPVIGTVALDPVEEQMFLEFTVSDNRGVEKVELWVDGEMVSDSIAFTDGKCSVDVTGYAGKEYQFIVKDAAGNETASSKAVLPENVIAPEDGEDVVIVPGETAVSGTIENSTDSQLNVGSGSTLEVIGDIINTNDSSSNIVLNTNTGLNVSGSVDANSNLFVSSDANVELNNFNGTDEGDDIYIGKDSVANFAAVDMKDGYDTAYIAGGVEFTADSVSNLDSLNIAAEGKVVVKNAWDVAGTDDAVIKVGSYASFEAGSITGAGDSVNLTLNRNANAVIGDANINKLTVQAGAMLKVGKVTATAEDNVFSMAGSTAVINGIDFGDGNDTLTLSSGANLILTGAIDGLERISANRSATIFVADTAAKDALAQISGYKESIVDIVDYQSGIVADGSIYDVVGGGNADLFVLSGDDTLTIDGVASENISYFSLADKTWLTATDNFSFNAADVSLVKVESVDDYKATLIA